MFCPIKDNLRTEKISKLNISTTDDWAQRTHVLNLIKAPMVNFKIVD